MVTMSLSNLEATEDLGEEVYFSHRFFEGLEDFDRDFDNYVLDVNVVYSVAVGREYLSDLFADTENAKKSLDFLGEKNFEQKSKGGKEIQQFSSTPSSRVEAVEKLGKKADIYLPDITEECLEASDRPMADREKVLEAFEEISSYLGVKEVMGIERYSREGLESADDRSEDKALIEATQELEGDTCILTYDEDFLSEDVYATVPEIAQSFS